MKSARARAAAKAPRPSRRLQLGYARAAVKAPRLQPGYARGTAKPPQPSGSATQSYRARTSSVITLNTKMKAGLSILHEHTENDVRAPNGS